jgi:hypothetical protein
MLLFTDMSSNIEAVRPGFLRRMRVDEGRRRAGFLGRRKGRGGPDFWGGEREEERRRRGGGVRRRSDEE